MLLGLIGAIYTAGMVKGLHIGQERLDKFIDQQADLSLKAILKNSAENIRRQQNAIDSINNLQTRNNALAARYQRLRDAGTGGRIVPAVSVAAAIVAAEPAGQPDAAARCVAETLAVLELGDRELAKYRELWELGQRNTEK